MSAVGVGGVGWVGPCPMIIMHQGCMVPGCTEAQLQREHVDCPLCLGAKRVRVLRDDDEMLEVEPVFER